MKKQKYKKIRFIAELCQNHLGNFNYIREMIKSCAKNGAEIIKLQHIFAKDLAKRYQFENGFQNDKKIYCIKRPYLEEFKRLKPLEIPTPKLKEFIDICNQYDVTPSITCFSRYRIKELKNIGFKVLKIASYDCGSFPLIKDAADNFQELIVSTGASYIDEIKRTTNYLNKKNKKFSLLHCTTIYPTPINKINIRKLNILKKLCNEVGFSDHSKSFCKNELLASKLSIYFGATVIERHITMLKPDKTKDGIVSITPNKIKELLEFSELNKSEQKKILLNKYQINVSKFNKKIILDLSDAEKLNRDYYRGRFVSKIYKRDIYNWEDYSPI